jgi:hypothetical protein
MCPLSEVKVVYGPRARDLSLRFSQYPGYLGGFTLEITQRKRRQNAGTPEHRCGCGTLTHDQGYPRRCQNRLVQDQ